jgi:hypothetical protein
MKIWVAADHCRTFSPRQIEAVVYHEALHVVGPKENVFYYMPGVVHHETWAEARCRLAVDAAAWLS